MKCEYALSHMPKSKVVNGYLRADLLEKCRQLMEAWGNYCEPQPGRQDGGPSHKGKKRRTVPAWWRDKRAVYDGILAGSKRMRASA